MRNRSKIGWVALWTVGVLLGTAGPAFAYVDPGTGSYIFQLVIGGILAAAVGAKFYWRKLKSIILRRPLEERDAKPVEES